MESIEQAYRFAADLYWITFLLTGSMELSVDLVAKELEKGVDLSPSTLTEIRRTLIAEALATVRDALTLSASQLEKQPKHEVCETSIAWAVDPHTSRVQVERAFLALDTFPRCALLLTVFEGLKIAEAGALLQADSRLVKDGLAIGLREFTRNLASCKLPPQFPPSGPCEFAEPDLWPNLA